MSYTSCWDSVRNGWRNCMLTPITKQKAIVFAGIVLFVMLFIIVLVLALPSTYSSDQSGSSVLTDYPVALGRSNLSYVLKSQYKNELYDNNATLQLLVNNMTYIGIQFWTVGSSDCLTADYKDAMPQIMDQIDAVQRLTDLIDSLTIVSGTSSLNSALSSKQIAGLFTLDGGYAIGNRISALRTYYNLGVRVMAVGGPSDKSATATCSTKWSETAVGNASQGLTTFGKKVIAEMNRLGIAIDLSGSSNQTITDTLSASTARVLFTSAGARNITSNKNNLSDEQLEAIANKSGLVMVSFDKDQLCSNTTNCTIANLIETINYIAGKVGRGNIALGGGSLNNTGDFPNGVNTESALVTLFDMLHNQTTDQWSLEELQNLSQENFLTFLTSVEEVSNESSVSPYEGVEPVADLGNNATLYPCITDWNVFYSTDNSSETTVSSTTVASTAATTATTTVATTVASTKKTN